MTAATSTRPPVLQAVRGMNDVLPDQAPLWQRFEDTAREVLAQYGYRNLRVPIVEPTALFVRGIGEHTDVVEKEMYTFEDKLNGERLTLRPEATAGIVRASIEHNLLYGRPQRVWTAGPMFRHERPQKGRYRQFHQLDVEALGFAGPDVDAEQIVMLARLWRALGLTGIALHVNSIGDPHERVAHRAALVAYLEQHHDALDADSRRRLTTNPLRILDTKNPAMQDVVEAAPKLIDFLGEESRAHFDAVCRTLDAAGQPYRINPRLVRGMDYYNRTVFEWVTDHLGSQGTICGGGRYDGLIAQMGGKAAPAIGFGLGVERLLLLLEELDLHGPSQAPDAYCVIASDAAVAHAVPLTEALRAAGVSVLMHAGGGSMKSQLKKADASGARYALILGDDEVAQGVVSVKALRGGAGEQSAKPLAGASGWAGELLA